jgi:hypothetical protein
VCAASQQSQPGQALPEDQIQQSYRHGQRSRPTATVLRCRRSPLWTTSSAPPRGAARERGPRIRDLADVYRSAAMAT